MPLFRTMLLRVLAITVLCLAGTLTWAIVDTRRHIQEEIAANSDRFAAAMDNLYWREVLWRGGLGRDRVRPMPDWRTLDVAALFSPGICVTAKVDGADPTQLCGQSRGFGETPPPMMRALLEPLFSNLAEIDRPVSDRFPGLGAFATSVDSRVALGVAWIRIKDLVCFAALMIAAAAVLTTGAIAHALVPVSVIVRALHGLASGRYEVALPRFAAVDLDRIACAVRDLATRLAHLDEERSAAAQRLIDIRAEERRMLARELHDEFGQNLTAVRAFAEAIEASAREASLLENARAISASSATMMACLRGALDRLRNPVSEEIGLEEALANMVGPWRRRSNLGPRVQLALRGDIAQIPNEVASAAYRIAQECMNNALKHGGAKEIRLKVERIRLERDQLQLSIEDDGVGELGAIASSTGVGLSGMRERIQSLGGSLSIGRSASGVRVDAVIPLAGSA